MEVLSRLLRLLSEPEKKSLRRMLAVAVGAAVMETAAVLSVLPFMAAVADPEGVLGHPAARWAADALGLETPRAILLAAGAAVLLLVVAANVAGALSLRRIHLTAWNINHYLSRRVLAAYLYRPYAWFLDRHSAGLTRNLLEEVRLTVQGALIPLLYAAVRGVSALLLCGLLLVVDARVTLIAGTVLALAYAAIYLGVRRYQEHLGSMRADATRVRYQVAVEALGGIKEVKSLGVEAELLRRFSSTGPPLVRAAARSMVVAELPRHLLEVLSVGTVLGILLVMLGTGSTLSESLPVLALFAFAGYKLVPSFHQVFTGLTLSHFQLPAIHELEQALLADPPTAPPPGLAAPPLAMSEGLALERVTFRYQGAAQPALDGVTLRMARGERVGVVGPTGSGKTTLVDVLLGLLEPQEGALTVDGSPVEGGAWRRWRSAVGYVPQSIFLSDDTIAGNVAFGLSPESVDRSRVEAALRMAELDAFVASLPKGVDTTVGERGVRLSGGQRQRIGIARALFRNPALLLLDEATSALDGATEEAVMDAVFGLQRERTVVIVAHRLATVQRCDRIVVLEDGRIHAEGTFEELMETSDLFRALARLPSEDTRREGAGEEPQPAIS